MYQPSDDPRLRDIESLGRGGTAEVVSAFHRRLKQRVAVKYALVQPDDSSIDFAALARREFDLIGGCRFPGLVRILETPSPQYDHLVLELCPGKTLDQVGMIRDLSTALNLVSALAAVLEFLNAVGLVHGDLKPHNVFLPENIDWLPAGRPGYIKLSDFSMGRKQEEHDRFRMGLGTVGYMAPETITDAAADHRSDLFALGIIAYQLLTGKHPFMEESSDPVEVNSRIRETSPPTVRQIRPDLSEAVSNLVDSLLSKEPSDRPESALEVCRILEEAGATYPYRSVLRPAHLLDTGGTYEENVSRWLNIDQAIRRRLDLLCANSAGALRLILNHNLVRGNLEYAGKKFRFLGPVIWPHRLRKRELARFAGWTFGAKRAAVRDAVSALSLGHEEFALQSGSSCSAPALAELLLPMLKVGTVKRLAGGLAKEADRQDAAGRAALLYLMAGSLANAERCAYQAAEEYKRDLRNAPALTLLSKVIESAEMTARRWEVRQLLMLRGDIRKENGEIEQARLEYQQLIDLYADRPKDKLLAIAYKALGDIHRMHQDTDASLASLEESLAVFTELGDELEISHTRTNMGNVHWLRGEYPEALRNHRVALIIQKRLNASTDYASTLHNIATTYCSNGRTRRGLFLFQQSLRLKKEIGNLGEIARTLNNLGYVYQISGQPAKAAENLAEALEINRKIGSKKELAYNLENLVDLMISAGRLRESMPVLREGIELSSENGYVRHLAALRINMATVQKRMGEYGKAEKSLSQAKMSLDEIDDKQLKVGWRVQRASLWHHLGNAHKALELARAAHAEAAKDGEMVGMLNSLLLVTRLSDNREDYDEADRLIEEQHLVREKMILDFGRLEYLIENDMVSEVSTLSDRLLAVSFPEEQDIELPWMLNLSAEMLLKRGEEKTAEGFLERSSRLASAAGLVPELIVSLTLQGKQKYSRGDYEGCFAAYKKALQLCKETSDNINIPEDRLLYQSKRLVRFLAGEIKLLSRRLGEKQRAG